MFILITLTIFILKFLALGVIGLFFTEDLNLTKDVSSAIYVVYMGLAVGTFTTLFFFLLGKKILWLIVCIVLGVSYMGMYNSAPEIAKIHEEHDLKSRYFKDTGTFLTRMNDVLSLISKDKD